MVAYSNICTAVHIHSYVPISPYKVGLFLCIDNHYNSLFYVKHSVQTPKAVFAGNVLRELLQQFL